MTIIHTTTGKFNFNKVIESCWTLTPLDIASALAKINRFGGHTYEPWSVAQHSLLTYVLAVDNHKRAALLHDMAEAIIGDVVSPLKTYLASDALRRLDSVITSSLWNRWGDKYLDEIALAEVHRVDIVALHTEAEALVPNYEARKQDEWPPLLGMTRPDVFLLVQQLTPTWQAARDLFLTVFNNEPTGLNHVSV